MESLYKLLQPRSLDAVIGNTTAVSTLRKVIDHSTDGTCPNILFTGPTGTGKSALAKLVKRLLHEKWSHTPSLKETEITEHSCAGIDFAELKEILQGHEGSLYGFRIYVLGEADNFNAKQRSLLLTELERIRKPKVGRAFFLSLIDPAKAKWGDDLLGRFPIKIRTELLSMKQREALINQAFDDDRASVELQGAELDREAFLAAMNKHNLGSPRMIYNALDLYYKGMTAEEAVTMSAPTQPLEPPRLSDDEQRVLVTELHAKGKSLRAIATEVGVSKSTVDRILNSPSK